MKKIKLEGNLINPPEIVGCPWPEDYVLVNLRRKQKVGAVKVEDGVITDYRKCIDSEAPRIYTIEMVNEDTFRLFQVGTYEDPTVFRLNGFAPTQFRSKAYFNWNKYRVVLLGGR